MVYSRWRPESGRYDYYETTERHPLGEDLPTPMFVRGTNLGVPSTEIGREPRGALRKVGSGALPRGSIMPIDRRGLGGFTLSWDWRSAMLVALGVAAGWYAREQWRQRS